MGRDWVLGLAPHLWALRKWALSLKEPPESEVANMQGKRMEHCAGKQFRVSEPCAPFLSCDIVMCGACATFMLVAGLQ